MSAPDESNSVSELLPITACSLQTVQSPKHHGCDLHRSFADFLALGSRTRSLTWLSLQHALAPSTTIADWQLVSAPC